MTPSRSRVPPDRRADQVIPLRKAWQDDQGAVIEDTPNRLEIGFCDPSSTLAQEDGLSLSLVFRRADPAR